MSQSAEWATVVAEELRATRTKCRRAEHGCRRVRDGRRRTDSICRLTRHFAGLSATFAARCARHISPRCRKFSLREQNSPRCGHNPARSERNVSRCGPNRSLLRAGSSPRPASDDSEVETRCPGLVITPPVRASDPPLSLPGPAWCWGRDPLSQQIHPLVIAGASGRRSRVSRGAAAPFGPGEVILDGGEIPRLSWSGRLSCTGGPLRRGPSVPARESGFARRTHRSRPQ